MTSDSISSTNPPSADAHSDQLDEASQTPIAMTASPDDSLLEGYRVKLEIFEGPLDLLLHLIKKNEVEIADISMAMITEQYLEYLNIINGLNIDVAGEFLVMASTLLHIKSQMLLPVEETEGENDEDGPDPREELIQRLLEYQRYKEAAEELRERSLLGRDVFTRQAGQIAIDYDPGLEQVSLFQLVSAFEKVLKEAQIEHIHEIAIERVTVRERLIFVMELLEKSPSLPFEDLFADVATRDGLVATFLAILELIRMQILKIRQTDLFGPIFVSRAVMDDAPIADVSSHDVEEYQ